MSKNARGLPVEVKHGSAVDYGYEYDANGNQTNHHDRIRLAWGSRYMTYDDQDRLTHVGSASFGAIGDGSSHHMHFGYDVLDNIETVKMPSIHGGHVRDWRYCYNGDNQLEMVRNGSTNCSDGAMAVHLAYDDQGNLLLRNQRDFDFDYGNRLREIGEHGAPIERYRYDGHGRRILASNFGTGAGSGILLSRYALDGKLMYQHSNRTGQMYTLDHIYLAGSLLAQREVSTANPSQVTVKYQHTDALGSPVAVTDQNGTLLERIDHEPYGKALSTPNSTGNDKPGYTGHVEDRQTGLIYMQQRYQDPQLGVFLSVDPVTAQEKPISNFNRYVYARNNPYRFTDPDGRDSVGEMIDSGAEGCGAVSCAGWAAANASWEVFGAEGVSQLYDKGFEASAGDKVSAALEVLTLGKGKPIAEVGEAATKNIVERIARFIGSSCSFDGSTLVITSEGAKPIKSVDPGDLVLARNEVTGLEDLQVVLDRFSDWHESMIHLEVWSGEAADTIVTSEEHPFYRLGDGFVAAGSLDVGERVRLANGGVGEVTSAKVMPGGQFAYNLTVANHHTFFVGTTKAWVHNTCGPLSINQMNKLIERGAAPAGIVRVDIGKVKGEQTHAVFGRGRGAISLNKDGTWKHHDGKFRLTRDQEKWLTKNGWRLPK